ncbi:MAG: GreA/GreB family elongation factor [Candidatus Wildermuthbacteria bacterium]|nr:GreA/GreB family elongation factor [Candidatus Wildermuthbacteria bacterium]
MSESARFLLPLIGKKVGDRASVQTPNGEQIYVIRTVS